MVIIRPSTSLGYWGVHIDLTISPVDSFILRRSCACTEADPGACGTFPEPTACTEVVLVIDQLAGTKLDLWLLYNVDWFVIMSHFLVLVMICSTPFDIFLCSGLSSNPLGSLGYKMGPGFIVACCQDCAASCRRILRYSQETHWSVTPSVSIPKSFGLCWLSFHLISHY